MIVVLAALLAMHWTSDSVTSGSRLYISTTPIPGWCRGPKQCLEWSGVAKKFDTPCCSLPVEKLPVDRHTRYYVAVTNLNGPIESEFSAEQFEILDGMGFVSRR